MYDEGMGLELRSLIVRESGSRVASEHLWTLVLIVVGCLASPLSAQDHTVELRARVERAREALARNDLPRAGAEYTDILKLDPHNIEVNAAHGVVLYGLRRPREAVAFLKNALRLDPNQRSA